MPSSNASRSTTYSPLSIPGSAQDRRKHPGSAAQGERPTGSGKIEYLDEHRRKAHSGTLQFDHDFVRNPGTSRPSYVVTGSRIRVADGAATDLSQPRLDPGRPASGRQRQQVPRQMDGAAYSRAPQNPRQRVAARPDRRPVQQARPQRMSARPTTGRPDLSNVTDFRTVAPTTVVPRPAPRPQVIDPDSGLPVPAKTRKKKRPKTQPDRQTQASKGKEPLMHDIEPRKNDPKRHEVGARLDSGESTVIGFDISRKGLSVEQRDEMRAKAKRERKDTLRKWKGHIATFVAIAIIFLSLAGLLVRYSQIATLSQANAVLEKSNAELTDEINRRMVELALEEDLGDVQDRATDMGMRPPADNQIEHVILSSEEVSSASLEEARANAALQAQQAHTSFFDIIWDWLSSLMGNKNILEE